jgi:hypothetical protein
MTSLQGSGPESQHWMITKDYQILHIHIDCSFSWKKLENIFNEVRKEKGEANFWKYFDEVRKERLEPIIENNYDLVRNVFFIAFLVLGLMFFLVLPYPKWPEQFFGSMHCLYTCVKWLYWNIWLNLLYFCWYLQVITGLKVRNSKPEILFSYSSPYPYF